jgi:AraC-like DNA-binding protein
VITSKALVLINEKKRSQFLYQLEKRLTASWSFWVKICVITKMIQTQIVIDTVESIKQEIRKMSVICLHRFHTQVMSSPAHIKQKQIGMSISLTDLRNRIADLSTEERANLCITIDDGHRDVLHLVSHAHEFGLKPILFMTGRQLRGEVKALPLTALYSWCRRNQRDPNQLKNDLGFDRLSLKHLRQDAQEKKLADAGIPIDPEEERMLDSKDIQYLISNGFRIGYHGPEHCDLRIIPHDELKQLFEADMQLFRKEGLIPEIAWPEGWWDDEISDIAYQVGFERQYGLSSSRFVGDTQVVWARSIWK